MSRCDTKYPILLIHGMGARDRKRLSYWGRIPTALRKNGAKVFFGGQDSNGSLETNAKTLCGAVERVIAETGSEKLNIIAHSKGGLEARYMISCHGLADRVASLTTLSTPHHGSITMDYVMKLPKVLLKIGSAIADIWFRILGDEEPDTYSCLELFTTACAERFNANTPDADGVYYQSYSFVMNKWYSDLAMAFSYMVVRFFEGENYGHLAPRATSWTNFRGIYRGAGARGVSHCQQVNLARNRLNITDGEKIMDITEFYVNLAEELKESGF